MRWEIKSIADIDAIDKEWGIANGEPIKPVEQERVQDIREIASIFSHAAQNIEFVVGGIVASGNITMISGEPGCGKTTFTTALCSAVERGVPFAGLPTQRRPVLILDRENPLPVVVERFDRLDVRDSDNFKVWGGWEKEEPPMPASPIVARWVEACNPKPLILVDSLVAFMEGDENDAGETREFFQGLRQLTYLGASVIVLHHSGKAESAKDYRGSSDIKAAIDVGFTLANFGDSGRLSTLRLKTFKARFTVQADTIFHYIGDQFEMDMQPVSKTNEQMLRELLIANPGISTRDLETKAIEQGVNRGRMRSLLDGWITAKRVRVQSEERNKKSYWWNEDSSDHEEFFR